MNITDLLSPQIIQAAAPEHKHDIIKPVPIDMKGAAIHDDELMRLWEAALDKSGFAMKTSSERNTLTDAVLSPTTYSSFVNEIPVHIKVIGRHMNGSFRCHIGTSKASRPIQSIELCRQMRLLVVFFRTENVKSQLVSPEFIFFPTWLLHLFRYTQHGSTPGRTDVRFLENANMAKEDHIYRLNHVLNTLFRFNIHSFDPHKMRSAIELANFLFDQAGLDYRNLPRPLFANETPAPSYHQLMEQPAMYPALLLLLHSPRPTKFKPMCHNCNTKPASRRRLCVACYRYQLKHNEPRPLRLIVANRPGPRIHQHHHQHDEPVPTGRALPMVFYSPKVSAAAAATGARTQKFCANCNVKETHQWYRNLCGHGNWCETCKSYYLRHTKVRPPELFVKAAKRKVDVRTLVNWKTWSWDDIPAETIEMATAAVLSNSNNYNYYTSNMGSPTTSTASSTYSYPTTPPPASCTVPANYYYYQQPSQAQRRPSVYSSSSSSSPTTSTWY
ncbi:GATA-type zinc finger transcription factor [Mucor lusitanicus]|uniref:GATA-type zinc finger transcription factor n=2 Tax=Mucor circinelloides f. lusitanicus TaxID=29924 RepID=A0A168KX97_MUCCL|nr:GATA-type zinc finger transcription factor [Mucor lusitanicus CBS 277.49]